MFDTDKERVVSDELETIKTLCRQLYIWKHLFRAVCFWKGRPKNVFCLKTWPGRTCFQVDKGDWDMIPLHPVKARYRLASPCFLSFLLLYICETWKAGAKGFLLMSSKAENVIAKSRLNSLWTMIKCMYISCQLINTSWMTFHYWRTEQQ